MKAMVIVLALAVPVSLEAADSAVLESYRAAAKQESPEFVDFSAARGEALYQSKAGAVACATCHGASPKESGKHATTGKTILPMAPSANPERFTDAAKVEKWFKRNCNDVLKRPCSALEKGDFMTYMFSVK